MNTHNITEEGLNHKQIKTFLSDIYDPLSMLRGCLEYTLKDIIMTFKVCITPRYIKEMEAMLEECIVNLNVINNAVIKGKITIYEYTTSINFIKDKITDIKKLLQSKRITKGIREEIENLIECMKVEKDKILDYNQKLRKILET